MMTGTPSKIVLYFSSMGFSGDDLQRVSAAFVLTSFEKNDLFVQSGKVSGHIGLVHQGMFQYFVDVDGDERTTYVSLENTFIASLSSFVKEVPSQESIRAIVDGSIYLIDKKSLKDLVQTVPAFKDFYINLLEQALCGIDASRHDLIVLSAEERYAKMLRQEPRLLQKVPLQYIASILGITPRHLSRIRSSIV